MPNTTSESTSDYVDVAFVQRHFGGASRAWVRTASASGAIPAPIKLGGRVLWHRQSLQKFDADFLRKQIGPL